MRNLFFCIIILLCSFPLFAQMPPHPELLKRIERGEVDKSVLPDYEELRNKGIDAPWSEIELSKTNLNSAESRVFGPSKPHAGKLNTLVILVSFPDNKGKDNPATFDRLLFSTNAGTMNAYFKEVSFGKIDMGTEDLPSKIGWIMAPQPYSYYVGTGKGTGAYPKNSQKLLEDVVKIVDSLIDFSKYDVNGDKKVDAILLVHAGPGAEFSGASSTQIWSHAWSARSPISVDGVTVSKYSIEPEYLTNPGDITVGVFCHELGHALFGLPDLYDTDNSSEGLGNWSLMAGGSWNGSNGNYPAHMDPWCKTQCGFITPVNVLQDSLNFKIDNAEYNPVAYRMWKNGAGNKEYFLIENRQKMGFDAGLPNSGLCIFHVDNNQGGNTNEWYPGKTTSGHYKVAMIQADGQYSLERKSNRGDAGDTYPGLANNRSFSSASFPSSLDYNSNATNINFQNITENNKTISLDLFVNDNLNPTARYIELRPHDLNTSADTLLVPLTNTGLDSITITGITNCNSTYKIIQKGLPKTLAPNEVFSFSMVFDPKLKGTYTDTITLTRTKSLLTTVKIIVTAKGYIQGKALERTIYASTSNWNNGNFVIINKSTGETKTLGASGFGDIISIAANPKTKNIIGLNQVTTDSAKFVKINAEAGDSYLYYKIGLGNITSIAYDTSGNLYGVVRQGSIYKIDLDQGTFKPVVKPSAFINAIAFNPVNNELWGSQFAIVGIKDNTYKINFTTGECVSVGRTGTEFLTKALFFDEEGKLFGVSGGVDGLDVIFNIDKSTGLANVIGSTGIVGVTGLAYLPGKITTGVNSNGAGIINTFSLSQNYPNPFNPSTNINYSIPQSGSVCLTIFNILGQAVKTLVTGNFSAGSYNAVWNADNSNGAKVSSGIYFYELKFNAENGNAFTDKKKMILVK